MTLTTIRTARTYQDGIEKHLTIKNISDFYNPKFEGISEQPVKNYEIYAQGATNKAKDQETFGFQEYAANLRFKQNKISGDLQTNTTKSGHGTMDYYHYGDKYSQLPMLNEN